MWFKRKKTPDPRRWGLDTAPDGALAVDGCRTTDLAETYGTPLHVVHTAKLKKTAETFCSAFSQYYPGNFSAHFAFKCNPVPGVLKILKAKGLKAEVMSAFELELAQKIGFTGQEIIVNGPFKPDSFLRASIAADTRFIVVDALQELHDLNRLAQESGKRVQVLLRINPDFTPKGMNSGTATGSRKGCAFGLDLKGGEADAALVLLPKLKQLEFQGLHFHIGTGIRYPKAYRQALDRLAPLVKRARKAGMEIRVLDIGGGFATPTTREMTTAEMLLYQATNRLPSFSAGEGPNFDAFAKAVTRGIAALFGGTTHWPELIAEPGRCIASPNQFLLLRVQSVKKRAGIGTWLITDGGIGTVSMPTFYEFHEVLLANDVNRPCQNYMTITGPGCFAADVVYKNKRLPEVWPGELLAVMDSGAYFTSWESNFGFPHPAVVAVENSAPRLLRHRETADEMLIRDHIQKPIYHDIHDH